jgi:hypothetical protein
MAAAVESLALGKWQKQPAGQTKNSAVDGNNTASNKATE